MAVIEKRELQEDGHYQVSLYDEEKQKLVHRWSENKNGKKDGEEIEYFEGTDKIKNKTNWKDGQKDGAEEIYEDVEQFSHSIFNSYKKYNEKCITEKNDYQKGTLVKSTKYVYPTATATSKYGQPQYQNFLPLDTELGKNKIERISRLEILNPCIKKDGISGKIIDISFEIEGQYTYGEYKMSFENDKEYEGHLDIKYCGSKYGYAFKQGKLDGYYAMSYESKIYENGNLIEEEKRHRIKERWSYNEKGELDGLNICGYYDYDVEEYKEIYKECTYKEGKLDGKYIETPEYNKRTVDCNYKDGKLDGSYFEETEDTRIECSYKDGNLNGEYKEYKRDEQGNFKLSKECSYKDGVLDGKYIEHANCRVSDHCSGFAWGKLDYRGLVSDLVYKDGQIISGKRYECEPDTRNVKTIDGGVRYIGDPSFVDEESDVKRTKDGEVVYPYIIIKKLYEYENESEYTCISYGDTKSSLGGTYWDEISKEHFKDGKLDGICIDREKGTRITYKEGKKNGRCIEPAEYGRTESTYKDDVLDGAYTEYFKNGKKRCEGSYSNGEKNGFWKTFADNGDLIEMRRYEHGKDVTEHYNKLKKIAAKHIAKEDERSEGKDERVVLKRKTKLGKAIDVAAETIKDKLHAR